jgi:hypothetical protein
MTAEWAAVYITVIGIIGTIVNLALTFWIRSAVLGVKLWVTENFVSKDDMSHYLSPLKQSITMVASKQRNEGRGSARHT